MTNAKDVGESESIRASFEAWITSLPYEREIKRWPNDGVKHAWPGQYCDITTQLAWEAWQESADRALEIRS